MDPLEVQELIPFVPSGPDYDGARALFTALGFTELWESGGYAGFRSGGAQFILQRFDDEHFASNLMITIVVSDLDAWWQAAVARSLEAQFPGLRMKAPESFPWGREVHFIDLAGVCWHVRAS